MRMPFPAGGNILDAGSGKKADRAESGGGDHA